MKGPGTRAPMFKKPYMRVLLFHGRLDGWQSALYTPKVTDALSFPASFGPCIRFCGSSDERSGNVMR